jgi:hypothetical protein
MRDVNTSQRRGKESNSGIPFGLFADDQTTIIAGKWIYVFDLKMEMAQMVEHSTSILLGFSFQVIDQGTSLGTAGRSTITSESLVVPLSSESS